MADITVGTIIEKFEKISKKKKRAGLLLLAVATFSALLAVVIYLYINRDLSYSHQSIIESQELLDLAAKSQPNPDIYASSFIMPDDPLFTGVYALQLRKRKVAAEALAPLAAKGNIEAMYWLGFTTLGLNILSSDAPSLIERSAKLGNPYAMRKLIPAGTTLRDCEWYLEQYCNDLWAEKAQRSFEEKVNNNPKDVRARYAASKELNRVVEAAKSKYYAPMVERISVYLNSFERRQAPSEEDSQKLVSLLTMAANDNFVPAMRMLVSVFNNEIGYEKAIFWSEKAMGLGSNSAVSIYFRNKELFDESLDRRYLLNSLPAAYVSKEYFGDEAFLFFIENDAVRINEPITDNEKVEAKKMAGDIVEGMKPVVYIDEIFDIDIYGRGM
ncbi:hypothetical protein TUM17387_31610 [Shewanella carassii]|uniref:hypothetical protein n=1 Tax=Shewanella carassii TaxID=1987584 RepID=UPI001BF187D7|nr:hypothetical protein [Shewanella carassii]BCV67802.1 hypothetical protein TUM17387_31610 [Shewanella carassii]